MSELRQTPREAASFSDKKNPERVQTREVREVTGFGISTNGQEIQKQSGEVVRMPASYPDEQIGTYWYNGGILGFVDGDGQMRVERVAGNDEKKDALIKRLQDAGYESSALSIPFNTNDRFVDESLQAEFMADWT